MTNFVVITKRVFVESAARLERTFREPQSDKLGALRQAQDKKQAD